MAAIIFSGLVLGRQTRAVDRGSGSVPRIIVELREPADAMGTFGWANLDPIPRETLEALLIASGVIV